MSFQFSPRDANAELMKREALSMKLSLDFIDTDLSSSEEDEEFFMNATNENYCQLKVSHRVNYLLII